MKIWCIRKCMYEHLHIIRDYFTPARPSDIGLGNIFLHVECHFYPIMHLQSVTNTLWYVRNSGLQFYVPVALNISSVHELR